MRSRLLTFATLAAACGGSPSSQPDAAHASDAPHGTDGAQPDAPPAVRRELGLEVDQPAGFDQGSEIDLITPDGVGVVPLTIAWSSFEPGSGGYDQDTLDLLAFAMGYYQQHGVRVMLSTPAIDTIANLVPSDLAGQALDSPAVLARARAFVDQVMAHSGSALEYYVLNNEVDINISDGSPTWSEVEALTAAMADEVHVTRPDVKTGLSVTASALLSSPANGSAVAALHANDAAFVTYYHAGNFGSPTSAGVAADLATIVGVTDRPVVMKELGYATGDMIGGSDAGQVQFVTDVFTAWDAHADRIPLVVYSRMFDGNESDCESQAAMYDDPGDTAFIQFLCTLGLRTYADAAKPAWATFEAAARARTWAH